MSLPPELAKLQQEVKVYAKDFGLDFFEVIFEVLDWNQVNMVASYGGFPNRYPHWRFGMEYERLSKSYEYGLSKIYEMVINNDPCYAYLLHSNSLVDQKMVMAHVYGHCDFFKNNLYFANTNRKMMDDMANHRTRIVRVIDRLGMDKVESFIDACLSLENLIDYNLLMDAKPQTEPEHEIHPDSVRLRSKPYMEKFINPPEFLAAERLKLEEEAVARHHIPEKPQKDILGFLLKHAPLEHWEADALSIVREEAYYFAPQGQTKVINEGWACLTGNTLVFSDRGLVVMKELVDDALPSLVHDGKSMHRVTDYARFPNRKTIRVKTRRGFELEGSKTHQILLANETTWKRLDEIKEGEKIQVGVGANLWPSSYVSVDWQTQKRKTLQNVADEVGVNLSTVIRHREGMFLSQSAVAIDTASLAYEQQFKKFSFQQNRRQEINIPAIVDESLASFLGYLVGDGHISRVKRVLGLTTGDEEQAKTFASLVTDLFGLEPRIKKDENRFRILFSSEHLADFLEHMGLTSGPSAREKTIPPAILKSPKKVVVAFLRALFDCDGYAGPQGVILSTSSLEMSKQVQVVLLNFGILSTRRPQNHDIWNIEIFGLAAKKFMEEIGFGLERKQKRLQEYIENHHWFKKESSEDEIISIEEGLADVYDITVEETHCYAAHGFINHNSFWHSKIMTEKALKPNEFIDYAANHSGTMAMQPGQLNPYKIGIELLRNIEERWNKGRFGKEYNECNDMREKKNWDRKLGLGREKIFEVRKLYNDVMFIDEFLTPEFCAENKMFVYAFNVSADRYEIATREFEKIKQQLLFQLTNFGYPIINVVDGNYKNRSELLLKHNHEGADLKMDWAKETLKALFRIWKRPVHIETIMEGAPKILSFDGTEHQEARP